MKNLYEAPLADVVDFESEDIITFSLVTVDDGTKDNNFPISGEGNPGWN